MRIPNTVSGFLFLALALLLAALGTAQCQQECKQTAAAGTAATAADEPGDARILQFRRELADPARYPIRGKDFDFDTEAFVGDLGKFLQQNGGSIVAQLNRSIEGLASGTLPNGLSYKRLAAFEEMGTIRGFMMNVIVVPDIRRYFRSMMSAVFPTVMRQELGLSPAQVSMWLGFLYLAEPDWSVCSKGDATLSVCADYGGLDVFVLTLDFEKPYEILFLGTTPVRMDAGMWAPKSFAWWRRR